MQIILKVDLSEIRIKRGYPFLLGWEENQLAGYGSPHHPSG
jgi:hypothetical protein